MLTPRNGFTLVLLFFLAGCAHQTPVVYDRSPLANKPLVNEVVGRAVSEAGVQSLDELGFEALIRTLSQEAQAHWGDQRSATRQEYVKYFNNYRTRVFVDFDQGRVHIETLDHDDLRHAIVMTLLTPDDPDKVDLFSDKDIALGDEPVLYEQVLDDQGQPIRWEWRASRYADYLVENHLTQKKTGRGTVYGVDFELVQDHMQQRQYQYASIVQTHARKYGIDESLIYAVMRTESSFNPYAVSHANAYGLMQVVPATAGRDVFQRLKNRSDKPTRSYLFQPWNNIDTGVAYLHILETMYLKDIQDPLSRRYAIISAYNGGAGNVFRTFSQDRQRAIRDINSLQPSQVYWALTKRHPLSESRRYLEKVTEAERDFHSGNV